MKKEDITGPGTISGIVADEATVWIEVSIPSLVSSSFLTSGALLSPQTASLPVP